MAGFLVAGTALAQFQPEPQSNLGDESSQMRAVQVGSITHNPPSELDLLGACFAVGIPYGYIDTNFDGTPDILRVFGADRVTADQWRQAGTRLLGPLRQRAVLRAQGEAAQVVQVHVAVDNGLLDTFSASLDSLDITSSSREQIRTTANAQLQGATVSGQRLISLENEEGICLLVRYDVPLSGNALPQGTVAPAAPSGAGASDSGDSPGHQLPPPGVTGDF